MNINVTKPTLKNGRAIFAKGGLWDDGDDAADALAKGWTSAHFAELESSGELFGLVIEKTEPEQVETKPEPRTKTAPKRPVKSKNDLMPGGFRLTSEGVFYASDDGEARPVCSPLEILARTRDDKGQNWGLLVEFDDPDGAKKRWNIPARTMTGDFGKDVLGPLVDMGLRLAGSRSGRNARNDLQSYLGGFDSAQRARLVTRLAEANKELKAGMEVRMLAVPADASKGLGMFDTLHGFEDAASLADALKARVAKYYGTPLTAFLTALCEPGKRHGWSAILRRTLEGFIAQSLPASASGQAHRAAARFGLAAAAGELATAMGITGWPDGTATTAARVCLNAWMNERGGAGNFEGDAILARLRQVIERFGESRFTRWESAAAKIDEHGPRTIDRLGFRKTLEHGLGDSLHTTNTYYVLPELWRSEIFRGMNINAVNKELLQRGVLEPGGDGKASSSIRLPGLGTQRCYVVKTIPGVDESEARAA